MLNRLPISIFVLLITHFFALAQTEDVILTPGIVLHGPMKVKPGVYKLNCAPGDSAAVIIRGNMSQIDFTGVTIIGSNDKKDPNEYYGTGLQICAGEGVHIKGLTIKGYKIGILALDHKEFEMTDVDCSYNYRPRLLSTAEQEDSTDWLMYKVNINSVTEDWLKYGAGIFIKNCNTPIIKNCKATNCQNGLMMVKSNSGIVRNCDFSFNSGTGVALYRANTTMIQNNKMDYCVRGYSDGKYASGQNSAGILLYDESNNNTISNNSVTHCGNGLLMRIRETMAFMGVRNYSGNLVYGNDFSNSVVNGIESFAGFNKIINNKITNCKNGLWGANTYELIIMGNLFENNDCAVAFQSSKISSFYFNRFEHNKQGIHLWHGTTLPYAKDYVDKIKDSISYDIKIVQNLFYDVKEPILIDTAFNTKINGNQFEGFEKLLTGQKTNEQFDFRGNIIYQENNWGDAENTKNLNDIRAGEKHNPPYAGSAITVYAPHPDPNETYQDVTLNTLFPKGKEHIIISEWGPYNYEYPLARLKENKGGELYMIELLGQAGNWKLKNKIGVNDVSSKKGKFPDVIQAFTKPELATKGISIEMEYIGESVLTPNGEVIPKGQPYLFKFNN